MKQNFKEKVPQKVQHICATLQNAGFESYIVGGSIRDLILGKDPKDWDITTDALPEEIQGLFPHHYYDNHFGTVGVVSYETDEELEFTPWNLRVIEVTPYRTEGEYTDNRRPDNVSFIKSIDEDLKRRDFTINSIAFDPIKDIIKDISGGIKDIENKVLRSFGSPDERFGEDALRLLRAVRISTQLEFTIEKETLESIKRNAESIKNISQERIRDELVKLISSNMPMLGFLMLEHTGLLEYILPELRLGIGMKQTQAHKYDVWGHLLRSMQGAADKGYDADVRLTALLHDIAKPHTARWDKYKNQNTFYGHDVVGEKVSREILERLKFPREKITKITKLVRWHMFFSDPETVTLSAVRRMVSNVGKDLIWELMNLRICDRIGTGRPKEDPYRLRRYHAMIEEVINDPIDLKMLKITGDDLIKILGEKPGPKLGFLLNTLMNYVLEDPKLNDFDKLSELAQVLNKESIEDLKEKAEKGKEGLQNLRDKRTKEIKKKHKI